MQKNASKSPRGSRLPQKATALNVRNALNAHRYVAVERFRLAAILRRNPHSVHHDWNPFDECMVI
jgi:hypothetical protein